MEFGYLINLAETVSGWHQILVTISLGISPASLTRTGLVLRVNIAISYAHEHNGCTMTEGRSQQKHSGLIGMHPTEMLPLSSTYAPSSVHHSPFLEVNLWPFGFDSVELTFCHLETRWIPLSYITRDRQMRLACGLTLFSVCGYPFFCCQGSSCGIIILCCYQWSLCSRARPARRHMLFLFDDSLHCSRRSWALKGLIWCQTLLKAPDRGGSATALHRQSWEPHICQMTNRVRRTLI